MVIQCPHCGKQLKAGEKFIQTVKSLSNGEKAKVKCTQCEQPFGVDRFMVKAVGAVAGRSEVKPPEAPDLSWLDSDLFGEEEMVEELPLVMLLVKSEENKKIVSKEFEALGYRVEFVNSSEEAIEKMQFVVYTAVVFDEDFESGDFRFNPMHIHVSTMNMARRRQMLYILFGKSFKTMYDLEALSYSANIVVNEKELSRFSIILRRAVLEYEALFGPIIEELQIGGK